MSIRTNQSPSYDFREKDNSNVTVTLNDTVSYVMGYAEKSEPYYPKYITTEQEFIKEFGKPTNDEEKYFYYACKSILDKGGKVLAARLPYDNTMEENYKYYGQPPGSPTLSVYGNSVEISNGSSSPNITDDTDLGAVEISGSTSAIYTITNTSLLDLTLNGSPVIDISGSNEFSVTTLPSINISPFNSETFVVTFSPTFSGVQQANVIIANDSENDNPYTFMIQGVGAISVYGYEEVTVSTPSYTIYEYAPVTI